MHFITFAEFYIEAALQLAFYGYAVSQGNIDDEDFKIYKARVHEISEHLKPGIRR